MNEVNNIPEGWVETTLGNSIKIVGGGTPNTTIEEYWNGAIPWLSVADFNNDNRWVYETEKSITDLGLQKSSTKLLDKGDLIISARGTVGVLAQLKKSMSFNQSCYGIKDIEGISDIDFLFYLIKSSVKQINRNTYGAVFDTITTKTFDIIKIKLPSLTEQKSIAAILTAFDDKIELLQAQNKTLEETAQTIFKEWFGKYQIGDELPEGWREEKISNLFEVRDGTHDSPKQSETGKPLITSRHIINNTLDFDNTYLISNEDFKEINKRSLVEKNDILYSMIGTLGLTYLEQSETIDYAIKNIALFKTSQKTEWVYYTYLWLNSSLGNDFIKNYKGGSTQEYISLGNLRSIVFVKPDSISLNNFNSIIKPIYDKIKFNQSQIQSLTQTRDVLLPKLMSGETRVKMESKW